MAQEKIDEHLNRVKDIKPEEVHPRITFNIDIQTKRFDLFTLKVAYEYTASKLGGIYLEDPTAIAIRNILFKATKGEFKTEYYDNRYVSRNDKMSDIMKACLKTNMLELANRHWIIFEILNNQLCLNLTLFMSETFCYSVLVSEKADAYDKKILYQPCIVPIKSIDA